MAKKPKQYQVFLTAEARELFSTQFIAQYVHSYHSFAFLDCADIDPDGVYLHVVDARPVSNLRPADFLIRHQDVLYISSALPDKTLGFENVQ